MPSDADPSERPMGWRPGPVRWMYSTTTVPNLRCEYAARSVLTAGSRPATNCSNLAALTFRVSLAAPRSDTNSKSWLHGATSTRLRGTQSISCAVWQSCANVSASEWLLYTATVRCGGSGYISDTIIPEESKHRADPAIEHWPECLSKGVGAIGRNCEASKANLSGIHLCCWPYNTIAIDYPDISVACLCDCLRGHCEILLVPAFDRKPEHTAQVRYFDS
jgi:hypothetical protein